MTGAARDSGSAQIGLWSATALVVALAAAGLFVLRRRETDGAAFRTPGYPATPALFVLFLVAVIASIALAPPLQAVAGFALVLVGLPAYRFLRRGERSARALGMEEPHDVDQDHPVLGG